MRLLRANQQKRSLLPEMIERQAFLLRVRIAERLTA
jgi:hypothetical protein